MSAYIIVYRETPIRDEGDCQDLRVRAGIMGEKEC